MESRGQGVSRVRKGERKIHKKMKMVKKRRRTMMTKMRKRRRRMTKSWGLQRKIGLDCKRSQ
jgi:hypothetical protein